jgi:hypothetical protein
MTATLSDSANVATEWLKQAAAAQPEQLEQQLHGCLIVHTERLGAREKIHYVEDSMRVRGHLVASAR